MLAKHAKNHTVTTLHVTMPQEDETGINYALMLEGIFFCGGIMVHFYLPHIPFG